jgi:uncharacterized protein (DUF849 family)
MPTPDLSHEQYLRLSENQTVRDALGRYDRGDLDYIQALERMAVRLLEQVEHPMLIGSHDGISATTAPLLTPSDEEAICRVTDGHRPERFHNPQSQLLST